MSLIKSIMEAADKIADGAPALELLLLFVNELGEELIEMEVDHEEVGQCIRRCLEAANEQIEERGY